jgi:acyl-CoA reductase-like NAD-dependent aldehyde dehydrogenase
MTTVDLEQQRLLIGGEWVEASGGGTFERSDPLTGDTVTRAAAAGREDARRAVDAAAAAFPTWAATPAGERRKLLNAAADTLMGAAPDIAAAMTEEVGGSFGWSMFNCDLASRMLRAPTATPSCSRPASSARAPTPRSCARWSTPACPAARST